MDKKEIRAWIKKLTKEKNANEKSNEAVVVTELLRQIIDKRKPHIVAAFMPMGDEISVDIEQLKEHCRIVIPRITLDSNNQAEMEFFDYNPADIHSGAYGINEPQSNNAMNAEDIDMMILPGVAFTRQGERLGRGKGFYDRYTSRKGFHAYCIGVCFSHQVLESLPTEAHDRTVDEIVIAE